MTMDGKEQQTMGATHSQLYRELLATQNKLAEQVEWVKHVFGEDRKAVAAALARAEVLEVAFDNSHQLNEQLGNENRALLARAEAAEEELEAERETNAETDGFLDRLIAALDHPIRGDEVFLPEIVETATALRARAEAAERERDEYKIQRDLFRVSDAELTARVADLEAQLAAQGWRPVTEKPLRPDRYPVLCPPLLPGRPLYLDSAYWNGRDWGMVVVRYWSDSAPLPAEGAE